jgi:HlyD family secretion protein
VKKLMLVLIVGALTLIGVAFWLNGRRSAASETIAWTTAPVEFGTLDEVVSATGLLQPREVFVVGSELAGKVVAVFADFNQIVHEGDVLLRLDDRMARQRLNQAQTAVRLAQAAVKEAESNRDSADKAVKRLREQSDVVRSQTELDIAINKQHAAEIAVEAARLKVQDAQNAQAQAELALKLTTIRAPILDGSLSAERHSHPGTGVLTEETTASRPKRSFVVLDRKVSLGQPIGSSLQGHLLTLAADLNQMRVKAQVGEGDIDKVRRGMAVRFTLSGAGEDARKYPGQVADIHLVPTSEHGAVYYQVLIDAPNERDRTGDWVLRPGQTASVDIIRRTHPTTWKLPTAALNFEPPAAQLKEAARAKLARAGELPDRDQWQTVWTVGADHRPWPVFVRTGGKNAQGETGIQDGQFTEVLEWDAESKPDANAPSAMQVITEMPPPKKSFFSIPNIRF